MSSSVTPSPSACAIPIRDGADGMEILMVRRNPKASAFAGAWTFPGGHIDKGDHAGRPKDEKTAARRAAAREAREEAGLDLEPDRLNLISRWTTPTFFRRRFRTWFFLSEEGGQPVRIDGVEIVDHRWIAPGDALAEQRNGAMDLPPPVFVLTILLSVHGDKRSAVAHFKAAPPLILTPKVATVAGGLCFLYPEDAGYGQGKPDAPGPRHRLWALKDGWRYEKEP